MRVLASRDAENRWGLLIGGAAGVKLTGEPSLRQAAAQPMSGCHSIPALAGTLAAATARMAPIRLLGCVALLSACYPQASYDSTMPAEPTLIAGPPGGGMDPEWQPGYYGDQKDPGDAGPDN